MYKIILFIGILFLQACVDQKPKSNPEENIASKETPKIPSTTAIQTLNYKELEPFLHKKNDTTYVVNFWATWCKPCIKELPAFEKLNSDYKNQQVKVILVSLDFPEHIVNQLIPFVEKRNIQSEVVLLDDPDANGWIPKISKKWTGAIPATLIYNKTERKFFERSFTFEELESETISILNKKS